MQKLTLFTATHRLISVNDQLRSTSTRHDMHSAHTQKSKQTKWTDLLRHLIILLLTRHVPESRARIVSLGKWIWRTRGLILNIGRTKIKWNTRQRPEQENTNLQSFVSLSLALSHYSSSRMKIIADYFVVHLFVPRFFSSFFIVFFFSFVRFFVACWWLWPMKNARSTTHWLIHLFACSTIVPMKSTSGCDEQP